MNNFQLNLRERNISKEKLIEDLKKVAKLLKKNTVTAVLYAQNGKYGVNTIRRRFGSWNKALQISGLEISVKLNNREEDLFENLAQVWQYFGRQPSGRDVDKAKLIGISKFSLGTYEKRFDSWNKALKSFIVYINESSKNEDGSPLNHQSRKKPYSSAQRTTRKINWRLRATVLIRDNCICKMCGASPSKDPSVTLHVDHIKAWSNGGETVLENLQTLCSKCNIGKSNLA